MGKISKYNNLYDKDGRLIRSVDSVSGRLDDYTIEELENLVDELAKDETKRTEYTNSMSVLMHISMKQREIHTRMKQSRK